MRLACERCGINPRAVNYKKQEKTYYRKICGACMLKLRKPKIPLWQSEGYKKKFKCESCGFVAKFSDQLAVCKVKSAWHTVCLNCEIFIKTTDQLIKKPEIKSDF